MKTTVLSILGTQKDASDKDSPNRWHTWRPNIGLVQQDNLPIDELHLIFSKPFAALAESVRSDIAAVSPRTKVVLDAIELKDAWDFEEVYAKFYDYAKRPCFHNEKTDYYLHMSTGTHVEKICFFLLAESHLVKARLIQTMPKEGHVRHSCDSRGTCTIIDLDLSRYDKLAKRFESERQDGLSFLKQGIETKNKPFNKLIETIERVVVRSSDPILLTGPTGAGKSQLAKQIYALKRQHVQLVGKFVSVNCATLGGDLAKSALFGYKKGAFTGADKDHDGYLKEADKGIIFLDEIGELPLEAQAMLLKAIEEKSFRPLSATKDESSDFELICGTNADLFAATRSQPPTFRADLLARINLWTFKLPGLADRREDIEPNLEYELNRFRDKTGRHVSFNAEARRRFLAFALDPHNRWPGNFRDLNAMVVRMATLSDGGRITEGTVKEEIARYAMTETDNKCRSTEMRRPAANQDTMMRVLGAGFESRLDAVDIAQLEHVIAVCRESANAADAAKKLFAVSRKAKKHANDSDRLTKFLARFGLKFGEIVRA